MGSPAPASNETESGSGKTACGIAAATSANPPSPGKAATRSPGEKPEPSGADRTIPATSEPGTNGSGGLIWYCPRLCSTSGKVTPAACTSTTTSPSPDGSSTSATWRADGPSSVWTCTARTRALLYGERGERTGADERTLVDAASRLRHG